MPEPMCPVHARRRLLPADSKEDRGADHKNTRRRFGDCEEFQPSVAVRTRSDAAPGGNARHKLRKVNFFCGPRNACAKLSFEPTTGGIRVEGKFIFHIRSADVISDAT